MKNYKQKLQILDFREFAMIQILQQIIYQQDGIEPLNFFYDFLFMINKQMCLRLVVQWYFKKAELFLLEPLFKGQDEIDHLYQIIDILGTPPKTWNFGYFQAKRFNIIFPEKKKQNLSLIFETASKPAIELLEKILQFDHNQRIKTQQILQHGFFQDQNIFFLSNKLRGKSIERKSQHFIPIASPDKVNFLSDISPKIRQKPKLRRNINPLSLSSNLQNINLKNKESILSLNLTQKSLQKNNSFTQPNQSNLFVKKLENKNPPKKLNFFQKLNKAKEQPTKDNIYKNQIIQKKMRLEDFKLNLKDTTKIKQPKLNLDQFFIK